MAEDDLRRVFASKKVVTSPFTRPSERGLNVASYGLLGCPFDVVFHLDPRQRLVRIDLTQVETLERERQYRACELVAHRLAESFGPPEERGYEKGWKFPSAEVTTGGVEIGQVYVTFVRRK